MFASGALSLAGWLLVTLAEAAAGPPSTPDPNPLGVEVRFHRVGQFGPPPPQESSGQYHAVSGCTNVAPNAAIFRAYADGDYGFDLWSTDGRTARRIMDVSQARYRGTSDSGRAVRVPSPDRFFFRAWGDDLGEELYVTDGTAGGSRLVADIFPGAEGSMPGCLSALGSKLYFRAYSARLDRSFFESDGTAEGTRKLWQNFNSTFGCPRAAPGGLLQFRTTDDGWGLWLLDPASDYPTLLGEYDSGSNLAEASPSLGGYTLFRANGQIQFTDGTPEGTGVYRDSDVLRGGQSGRTFHKQLLNGKLLGASGRSLYLIDRYDGAAVLLTTVYPDDATKSINLGSLTRTPGSQGLAGGLFFVEGRHNFLELWGTNGTEQGTRSLLLLPRKSKVRTVPVGDGMVYVLSRGSIWLVDAVGGASTLLSDDALEKFAANIWADGLNDTAMVFSGANQTLWTVSFERPRTPPVETPPPTSNSPTRTPAGRTYDSGATTPSGPMSVLGAPPSADPVTSSPSRTFSDSPTNTASRSPVTMTVSNPPSYSRTPMSSASQPCLVTLFGLLILLGAFRFT